MTNALARALSIVGHPMLVLPLAVLALTRTRGDGGDVVWLGLGFGLFAATVMGYSWWQVRRGRWGHVDASAKHERGSLNRFLLIALAVAALLATVLFPQNELALGLGLSAGLIGIAMLAARCCKLSLHMAFAVFATLLLARLGWGYGLAGAILAAAIGWSRLSLRRHTPGDLLAGAAAGALAGSASWWVAAHSGG
jgi:hypothetical protein